MKTSNVFKNLRRASHFKRRNNDHLQITGRKHQRIEQPLEGTRAAASNCVKAEWQLAALTDALRWLSVRWSGDAFQLLLIFVCVVRDPLIRVTIFLFGISRSLRRNGNRTLCYENVTHRGAFFCHSSYAYHLPHSRLTYSPKLTGNSARKRPGLSSDTAPSLQKWTADMPSSLTGCAYTILLFQHSSSHTTPLTILCFRSFDT